MKNLRSEIRKIFDAGLNAADPGEAVRRIVRYDEKGEMLYVEKTAYDLRQYDRILVSGAGKASAVMAAAIENLLERRIDKGIIITKYGYSVPLKKISVIEAGHPVPDDAGLSGTKRIVELLEKAGERDLIICLVSGGGSALLPLPVDGLSLLEKQQTTQELLACGATIHEVNAIRKHISGIKGGQFAKIAYPATLIVLILSDVIGDDLDVIASGPAIPDRSTFSDCLAVLKKYNITEKIPQPVAAYLTAGSRGLEAETPKPGDVVFEKVNPVIIGSASLSIDAAQNYAEAAGYNSLILSSFIEGETREVAKVHAAIVKEIVKSGNPVPRPACIISGGETTVTIRGSGIGGRNMEFALAVAIEIDGLKEVAVLSGGTDGTDGPTDAAGAIIDGQTVKNAAAHGFDALSSLNRNDSYTFFKNTGELLMTGPTGTNVMDLRILLIE